MKKRILLGLCLLLAGLLLLLGCAPSYRGDARIGSYTALGADGKTVNYRLVLYENGEGEIVHYPSFGGETKEKIIFEFEDEFLVLHGTEAVGGVVGRNEYLGEMILSGDSYSVELRAMQSSVPLALFTAEK